MTDIILTSLALGFLGGLWAALLANELSSALNQSGRLRNAAQTLSQAGHEKARVRVEERTKQLRRELGR
jgi:hypothetical protein